MGNVDAGLSQFDTRFTIRPVVRNGWTVKQANNSLLSRWSERQENDRYLTVVLANLENDASFIDIFAAICNMEVSLLVRMTEALCQLLCLDKATPA